jgi:two-component system response regulator TctD
MTMDLFAINKARFYRGEPSDCFQPVATKPMRVLVVEDNAELATWIERALRDSGMVVDSVHDGSEAAHILLTQIYDVVLLDLGLPRLDGLALLRRLRARKCLVPVLILTARSNIEDRIRGLDAGADDYLGKPFDLAELEARMRALVRRAQGAASNELAVGALQYDASTKHFRLRGESLSLSPRERNVLEILTVHAKSPVSKELLANSIVDMEQAVTLEAIEIYIHRLRRKLEGSGVKIRTLRGLGYMIETIDA